MKALLPLLLLAAAWLRADESASLAHSLWETSPETRASLARPVLSLVLLSEHARLLPKDASPTLLEMLATHCMAPNSQLPPSLASLLPPADSRFFNGTSLSGGNFAAHDSLISLRGQPVAFDRQIPTLLVPLKESESPVLEELRASFQERPETAPLRERTNRLLQAQLGEALADDGLLLRPYAGKLDDLYVRLFQEGDTASQTRLLALLETLPDRTYHPVSGSGPQSSVPPLPFSLSDMLSGGGLSALRQFALENPNSKIRNPFSGIALHLLSLLDPTPNPPGSSLSVTHETMRRALQSSRRFSPPEVKPLFRDPSRFLGSSTPAFLPVKNGPFLSREEVEKELPLPQSLEDPAANEAFRGPVYWENPANNPLLPNAPNQLVPATPAGKSQPPPASQPQKPSSPGTRPSPTPPLKTTAGPAKKNVPSTPPEPPVVRALPVEPAVPARPVPPPPDAVAGAVPRPSAQPSASAPQEPPPGEPGSPTYRPKPRFLVAVLLPPVEQGEVHLRAIAENDEALRAGVREENHALCKARWLVEALGVLESQKADAALRMQPGILAQAGALRSRIEALRSERLQLLKAREALRSSMEAQLRDVGLKKLRAKLGTPL